MEPEVITVGVDGSPESLAAAHWAADEADRRQWALRLLHAWILLAPEAPHVSADRDRNAGAREVVRRARDEVRVRHPGLRIIEDLVGAEAEPALLGAAGDSRMVVLGSRALGPWESYVLGDVSLNVVGRAKGPVVLVREEGGRTKPPRHERPGGPPPAPEARVVAGLSLNGPCERMLGFAFDAAASRGLALQAVHGRPLPVQAYTPWGLDPDAATELTKEADAELQDALGPWCERFPEVPVQRTVLPESPTRALVQSVFGAELLVVGRKLHRPPLAPRVGPVAHAAIHHVTCPIAVVPHE
ncbi:Nucleotide-binding universal stress protein, UspA family [Streptomyces sp. 2224.1]|uniref:universal stress protein n=1 Tax=unclassified Streptomyces TaxID=2593676 RepID=UPI000895A5B6|nr:MULTISPECIES: universal stress protein [unclassified Streptomyces]SED42114.1 Nucleotide-binding universal stress protein, UspA family [Streptomyces sp. 2224.1]SEF13638.1 Nucleotide-binding universal stress protein, UspA family [Streptomyces sp. 2112.3]